MAIILITIAGIIWMTIVNGEVNPSPTFMLVTSTILVISLMLAIIDDRLREILKELKKRDDK